MIDTYSDYFHFRVTKNKYYCKCWYISVPDFSYFVSIPKVQFRIIW